MAKPNLMVYVYFFIFLSSISAESGSGSETSIGYDTCADAEQDYSFECFTQMPVFESNFLICNATGTEMNLNETNAYFSVYGKQPRPCFKKSPLVSNCSIEVTDLLHSLEVCLTITLMNPCKDCQKMKTTDIIKPEAPFGLNITYQGKANEYLVQFSTPHTADSFLGDKLIHQLAYRQENTDWTDAQKKSIEEIQLICIQPISTTTEFQFLKLKLMGKKFEPEVRYEMKVRSKPNGSYFKGSWSEWSSSKYFKTPARLSGEISRVVLMTISFACFFVLLIAILLVSIFWRNRIKTIVWPDLPNHKRTLAKLCIKKNSDSSFFNPEDFGYAHIHKVESIQAKSDIDHLQPPSRYLDGHVGNTVDQKNNIKHLHRGWLKLPLSYEGILSTEMQNQPSIGSDHNLTRSTNLHSEGRVADQLGWINELGKYSSSSVDHTILPESETGSCCQAHPSAEKSISNKEETYVTMASFFENKGNLQTYQLQAYGDKEGF